MKYLEIGSFLQNGKYKIVRVLGQGGFGITYEGLQVGLNRKVAIKEFFLREYCERDGQTSHVTSGTTTIREIVERFREKFIKEAQMIASFDRAPHIVPIYDIFEENGTAYYVMRFIEGGSLSSLVKEHGALPVARAVSLISQIGQALSYLHSHQTMHLDVKPANILLDHDADGNEQAVLIDFGISKHYTHQGQATTTSPIAHSKGFAPLEQYREGGVQEFSPTSDVYSLGATLYYLLTAQIPPEATFLIEEPLERPTIISNELWKIITTSMATSRKQRYQSVDEMMQVLLKLGLYKLNTISNVKPIVPKSEEFVIQTSKKSEETTIVEKKTADNTRLSQFGKKPSNPNKPVASIPRSIDIKSPEEVQNTKIVDSNEGRGKKAIIGVITIFVIVAIFLVKQYVITSSPIQSDPVSESNLEDENSSLEVERSKTTDVHYVLRGDLYGFVNQRGKLILPYKYKWVAERFSEGLQYVEDVDNHYGWIDTKGNFYPSKMKSRNFSDGLAVVEENDKYGYIDKTGNIVIPCQWRHAESFIDGRALVQGENGKYGFIDKSGKLVIPCIWDGASNFEEGLARVHNDQYMYGFINIDGKLVIPCIRGEYDIGEEFHEGFVKFKTNDPVKWEEGFLDIHGRSLLGEWTAVSDFREGFACVSYLNMTWFINNKGEKVISGKWTYALGFSEGMSAVELNNKYGYIDKTGNIVSPYQWSEARDFSDGMAAVRNDEKKWGYIDKRGNLVIPCQWPDVGRFVDGKAWVRIGRYGEHTYRLIDKTGKYFD